MFLALIALLLLFPITMFTLLPAGMVLTSLRELAALPGQLIGVALDRRRRRNHALEHATANVLEQRYSARLPFGGFAETDGFLLQGPANASVVLAAAQEGLSRLQAGESDLARHPRSGTTLVTGQLISAAVFILLLLLMGKIAFFNVVLAMLVATMAARYFARPVGMLLQRLTTSTDVHGIQIDRVDSQLPRHPFALVLSGGQPTEFRIWTREIAVEPSGAPKRYRAY